MVARLVAVLANDEPIELLRHFLKHYRALGVTDFHFICNGVSSDSTNYEYCEKQSDVITYVWNDIYNEYRRTYLINEVRSKHGFDELWYVVDIDELVELTHEEQKYIIDSGCDYVMGHLIERLPLDMRHVGYDGELEELFPIEGNVDEFGIVWNKVFIARGNVGVRYGQHDVIDYRLGGDVKYNKFPKDDYKVYHYKWGKDIEQMFMKRIYDGVGYDIPEWIDGMMKQLMRNYIKS